MASFATLDALSERFSEARVLVRLDLNSPIEDGTVQDNRRSSATPAPSRSWPTRATA